MPTRINPRQMGATASASSNGATNMAQQLENVHKGVDGLVGRAVTSEGKIETLEGQVSGVNSDINSIKKEAEVTGTKVSHMGEPVAQVTDLPVEGAQSKVRYVYAEKTYYSWDPELLSWNKLAGGTSDSTSGGTGGSDAALEERVTSLEAQTSTATKLYTETFGKAQHVDVDKTTAVVGPGYVRAQHTPSFIENFSPETHQVDTANSANVEVTADGMLKLVNTATKGVMQSKSVSSPGVTGAEINGIVHQSTALSFSDETVFAKQVTTYESGGRTALDRNGRRWYMKVSAGLVWVKIEGPTAAESKDWTSISVTVPTTTDKPQLYTEAAAPSMAVDYNNKVWILVPIDSTAEYAFFALNPDLSFHKSPEEIDSGSTVGSTSIYVDRNNNIWTAVAGTYGATMNVYSADGTKLLYARKHTATCESVHYLYDERRDYMHLISRHGYSISTFTHDLSFNAINSNTNINPGGSSVTRSRSLGVGYDPVDDSFLISTTTFAPVVLTGNVLQLVKMKFTATGGFSTATIPAEQRVREFVIPASNPCLTDVLVKDGVAYVVFERYAEDGNARLHYTTIRMGDFVSLAAPYPLIAEGEPIAGLETFRPQIFLENGNISVIYDIGSGNSGGSERFDDRHVRIRRLVLTETKVRFYLSNDNGVKWLQATPGQYLSFPASGSAIKVRIEMDAVPNSVTISPLIDKYEIALTATDGAFVRQLVTSSLPAINPTSQVRFSPEVELLGGTVDWSISNDGGRLWETIVPGAIHKFVNYLGHDVRLRATITKPAGGPSPIIRGYHLVSANTIIASDVHKIEVNLMKTNFKLAAFQSAVRYSLKDMIVDTFTDISGINAAKSSYTYNSAAGSVSAGTVTSVPETVSSPPTSLLLVTDETLNTGAITYEVSRDNGTSWTAITPNQVIDLSAQPSGTNILVKAVITGNATLNAWSYSWK